MASVHKLLLAVLLGFLFTAIPGPAVIRFLKRMDFRQSERQEGPPSHQKKAGTPTVGGVFLLLGWLLASLIGVREGFSLVLPVLLVTVLCGLMGFLDDFIKISTGTSMGLLPCPPHRGGRGERVRGEGPGPHLPGLRRGALLTGDRPAHLRRAG